MKKTNILVTGGLGFIGSHFIKHILDKYENYCVTNLDKLTYAGNLNNLKNIEDFKRYVFIRGDICDKQTVMHAMKNCEIVINFAAESHVDRSIEHADDFIKTNVYGTYILLESAKTLKIKKFIQISTDEVYGSIANGSFNETSTLNPSSPYSASKASADLLVISYKITFNLPTIIIRPTNNFGPCQYPEKIIPLFTTKLLNDQKVPVYAKGENKRTWLYVEDNCREIDVILHNGNIGDIYNIGGETELSNIELTKTLLNILNKPDTYIEYVTDRKGHDYRYAVDSSKIKELGWQIKESFDKNIEKTVHWYCVQQASTGSLVRCTSFV